jgi:hypothetical protein
MTLCEVYEGLGMDRVLELVRLIQPGKLRTYQMYDRVKTRMHLDKINQEGLRRAGPRVWARIQAREEVLAVELAQAILVCHLDMVVAALDFLKIPHNEGFFEKDFEVRQYLNDGWQQSVLEHLRAKHPEALVLFYLNHLAHEVDGNSPVFLPAAA